MSGSKKHPCPDCTFCQFCSEIRCNACRGKGSIAKKLTIKEQIELFEKLNAGSKKIVGPIYYKQCKRCAE